MARGSRSLAEALDAAHFGFTSTEVDTVIVMGCLLLPLNNS
jgi:hypothetical protein